MSPPARPARAAAAAALGLALAGCPSGDLGTIALGLTTAPGSTVMDGVARLHVTLAEPGGALVFERTVERTERGFDLVIDLPAADALGAFVVEGLDAGGALLAAGMSPAFPLSAITARVVVYMAPPLSIGAAPVALDPPRSQIATAALSYGAIFAGGVGGDGAPSAVVQIYNAFDHSLVTGKPLLAPRAGVAIAPAAASRVYLFGGAGTDGAPTGTLWSFDTTAQDGGRYLVVGDEPQLARAGALAVATGGEHFRITGAPPVELFAGNLSEPGDLPAISSGAAVTGPDRVTTALVVDAATGDLLRVRAAGAPAPVPARRAGGAVAALPDSRLVVLGGATDPGDAIVVAAATGDVTTVPGALAGAYATLAVAGTPRFVVAAGTAAGVSGTTVEILDAATLAPRLTVPLADAITAAIALPNEQVLLVGDALHLFTPPPP